MRLGDRFARLALRVGEQRQRPGRGDARIELPQPAGGGVARIGEQPLPRVRLALVQRQEIRLGHEHLAADFDQRGSFAMQPVGHRLHGAEIGGDILAFGAVAAGRSAHETSVFVGQIDRQAVDLRLGDETDRSGRAEKTMRACHEIGKIRDVERVVERQHRHAMPQFGETAIRRAADPVRRRIGADQ